ncbi:MAG: F-type H+-transporting ATPase subunit b, partial [Bacteroidia bacterium]
LIIWMTLAFLIVWIGLGKFAWPAIMNSINERTKGIEDSLAAADKAKEEMAKLQADNQAILKEAREEQSKIIAEAREIKDKIVSEAKDEAKEEADKLVSSAKESIENEKMAAMTEIKNHVATLSIDIAEKILKGHLADEAKQKELINTLLEDVKLN